MKQQFMLIMLFISTIIFSQQNVAQYYFPLQIGNCWQFTEGQNIYKESRIVCDSIMPNNKKYAKIEGVYLNGYYRTEGSKVYLYQSVLKNLETVFYDFSLSVGDTVSRIVYPGTTHIITVNSKGTMKILGQQYNYLRFFRDDVKSTADGYYYVVYGLGLVSYVGELMYYSCTGAIIDGKQYGVILNVTNPAYNIPLQHSLSQNYPNPFNLETTVEYTIPANVKGETTKVTLKVYDLLGREVATLVDEYKQAGNYRVTFNVKTPYMASLPSGVYFYRLRADSYSETKKIILMK